MCAAVCPLILFAGGCGDDNDPADQRDASPPEEDVLTVGDSATFNYGQLDDPDGVGALRVTVTRIDDPMKPPKDKVATSKGPGTGGRYVAIHTRIENLGDRTYADSLYGAAQLVDDRGNLPEGVQLIGWDCESALEGAIPSGAQTEGCEVYELPSGTQPARFVLTDGERELASWEIG
jgi:hypothetical protein